MKYPAQISKAQNKNKLKTILLDCLNNNPIEFQEISSLIEAREKELNQVQFFTKSKENKIDLKEDLFQNKDWDKTKEGEYVNKLCFKYGL